MNKELLTIFEQLKQTNNSTEYSYAAADIPFSSTHKIGVTEEGNPIFFIKSNGRIGETNINLELITVLFDQTCNLVFDNDPVEDTYTVVFLKSNDFDLALYFVDVMSTVLEKAGDSPSTHDITREIKRLIELFRRFSQPPKRTLQGLWAELFIIERSSNAEYLIRSWHHTPTDIFDFNDGRTRLEVKSTLGPRRTHRFSLSQLPQDASEVLIASVFVQQTGNGASILDLRDSIISKLSSFETKYKLDEIIIGTLGCEFKSIQDYYFDYQEGVESYNLYFSYDIPSIARCTVPLEVTDIHFDSDISEVQSIDKTSLANSNSPLIKAL